MTQVSGQSFWDEFSGYYRALGSPVVPCNEDLQFIENAVDTWAVRHPGEKLRALLLGVTPAIVSMRWPEKSFLLAVERHDQDHLAGRHLRQAASSLQRLAHDAST